MLKTESFVLRRKIFPRDGAPLTLSGALLTHAPLCRFLDTPLYWPQVSDKLLTPCSDPFCESSQIGRIKSCLSSGAFRRPWAGGVRPLTSTPIPVLLR